jgi:hypothetical protein
MSCETTETSVLVSLNELTALENERLREDERAREQAHEQAERARRLAEEQRRAAETARLEAEAAARARRAREEAEERARLAAIERSVLEQARHEREQEARREAARMQLEHELALGRIARSRPQGRRTLWAVAIALALGGASIAGAVVHFDRQYASLSAAHAELELRHRRLLAGRLLGLDRQHHALRNELALLDEIPAEAEAARARAAEVRAPLAIDTVDDKGLTALADALGALEEAISEARLARRLGAVDQARAALGGLLAKRPTEAAAVAEAYARTKSIRERIDPGALDERALATYESAFRALALAVASNRADAAPAVARHGAAQARPPAAPEKVCDDHDPLCDRLP